MSGLQATLVSVTNAGTLKRTDGMNLPDPKAGFTGQNLQDAKTEREINIEGIKGKHWPQMS